MSRTNLQKDANRLDMIVFATAARMEEFAEKREVDTAELKRAARALLAARHLIRKHMHAADVEATQ